MHTGSHSEERVSGAAHLELHCVSEMNRSRNTSHIINLFVIEAHLCSLGVCIATYNKSCRVEEYWPYAHHLAEN